MKKLFDKIMDKLCDWMIDREDPDYIRNKMTKYEERCMLINTTIFFTVVFPLMIWLCSFLESL